MPWRGGGLTSDGHRRFGYHQHTAIQDGSAAEPDQTANHVFALNAVPCSFYFYAVQYPTLADVDCSPACLLDTGDVACESVQTELELHKMISIRSSSCMQHLTTYSCHAEVSENTSSLCAHDTAVPDLCRASVAVHLAELELRLRAGTLRQGGVANNVAKSLSVQMSFVSIKCFLHAWPCDPGVAGKM